MTFNIEERKKQREEILIKAYSYYYNGDYKGYSVSFNLQEKGDREAYSNYIYLQEKKWIFIYNHHIAGIFFARITANGVEEAERLIKGGDRK